MLKFIILIVLSNLLALTNVFAFDPTKQPVNIIIPFPPGGGVDKVFRPLEKYAQSRGITFTTIYKPGAEGTIGMNELTEMPKDGYNLAIATAGVVAAFEIAKPNKTILTITGINDTIGAFVVNSKSNIKTIEGLCQSIQKGEDIKFGYGAPGQRIMLNQLLNICKSSKEQILVPYKGGVAAVNDLLGGQIDMVRVPLSLVIGHINVGNLRLLAVSRTKIEGLSIPTIESKLPKWKEIDGYAILAPENVNGDAVKFWSEFLKDYLKDVQVQKQFTEDMMVPLPFGADNFNRIVQSNKIKLLELKN